MLQDLCGTQRGGCVEAQGNASLHRGSARCIRPASSTAGARTRGTIVSCLAAAPDLGCPECWLHSNQSSHASALLPCLEHTPATSKTFTYRVNWKQSGLYALGAICDSCCTVATGQFKAPSLQKHGCLASGSRSDHVQSAQQLCRSQKCDSTCVRPFTRTFAVAALLTGRVCSINA